MAFESVVVAYASGRQAMSAIRAVRTLGIPASDIRRHPAELSDIATLKAAVVQHSGIWGWLFGRQITAAETAVYEKAVESGGTVISVDVMEEEAENVRSLLQSFGPLSIAHH